MSWKDVLKPFVLPVLVPGISHFKGTCTEQGRSINFELEGYFEGIEFNWKATVVDIATGQTQSAQGYLNKDNAMKAAIEELLVQLTISGNTDISTQSSETQLDPSSPAARNDFTPTLPSQIGSSLSVSKLDEKLKELVCWERLAIHLPGITPADTEMIVRTHRDIPDQKLAFYKLWLRRYSSATWDDVVLALRKIDEHTLAEKIKVD